MWDWSDAGLLKIDPTTATHNSEGEPRGFERPYCVSTNESDAFLDVEAERLNYCRSNYVVWKRWQKHSCFQMQRQNKDSLSLYKRQKVASEIEKIDFRCLHDHESTYIVNLAESLLYYL
jgi:hypothetical protein